MSDETPLYQHSAPITLDVLGERLKNVIDEIRRDRKDWKQFMDDQRKAEAGHIKAIEHCRSHDQYGEDIAQVRNEELPALRDRVTNLESSDKIQASTAKPDPASPPVAKSWPDVFFHPATPMAFCIVAMLIFFIVFASAKTGRDANTLVPHAAGGP